MYKEMIDNMVTIIVSSRAETLLEYTGFLMEENEKSIKLKNVSINFAMLNFQKSIFGSSINTYKENIDEVILNKDHIISCNKI